MKVNVLGTKYKIIKKVDGIDPKLEESDGYCDTSTKEIVFLVHPDDVMNKEDMIQVRKSILRHEIIHAFLYESGLEVSTHVIDAGWATNEEMVDWIAIQFPKILKAFKDVGAL